MSPRGPWTGALAFLAAAAGAAAPARADVPQRRADVVIRVNGQVLRGVLRTCTTSCRIASNIVPRAQVAWIGFAAALASPPPPGDASEDEVHLRDGTVRREHLLGVTLDEVRTAKGSYARQTVAWIHLAPPAGSTPPSGEIRKPVVKDGEGGGGSPQQPTEPPRGPGPGASPGEPSGPRPPRPSNDRVKACPLDKPLGGRIEIVHVSNPFSGDDCQGTVRTVLRFPLVPTAPAMSPWTSSLWAGFDATELAWEVTTGGCVDTPGNRETCQAPPSHKSGTVTLGTAGPMGFRRDTQARGALHFSPVKPELYFSVLPREIHDAVTAPMTCTDAGGRVKFRATWSGGLSGGDIRPRDPRCAAPNPFVACVQPTACADAGNSVACIREADRYAVIPFAGHTVFTDPRRGADVPRVEMTWKVCCGCGAPSAPPERSTEPCPSTLEADSRLKTNRAERDAKARERDAAGREYREKMREARAHYGDYKATLKACLVQSLVTKAIISLLAPEAEGAEVSHEVAEAIESAEASGLLPPMGMQQVAEIVEKIIAGEDPTTALGPEGWQNWNETMAVLDKVATLMAGGSADKMEKDLEECQGAFLVSAATKLSADKCVEAFKDALASLAEFDTLRNDIRNLDDALPNLQYEAWAACVRRARCLGTPESDCADRKPPGNWPDVD
jgi:hypothetical protein